jgi:hypothetical protein
MKSIPRQHSGQTVPGAPGTRRQNRIDRAPGGAAGGQMEGSWYFHATK